MDELGRGRQLSSICPGTRGGVGLSKGQVAVTRYSPSQKESKDELLSDKSRRLCAYVSSAYGRAAMATPSDDTGVRRMPFSPAIDGQQGSAILSASAGSPHIWVVVQSCDLVLARSS